MRKILLTVLTGAVIGLAGLTAEAAPINGAAVGNASEGINTITKVQHWRWGSGGHWRWGSGGHWRWGSGGCVRVRVCGPYGCRWVCR
jgi:hypothetical protein